MEAAASPSPPPSRASPLRLNPAAFLLRTTTTTTVQPTTSADAPPPPPPTRQTAGVDRLISFLSSLIPRRGQRAKQPTSPPPTAAAAAMRRAAEREAEAERQLVGCAVPLFRPYVAQLPWHGGARAWLSRMFPRYGHYCGPNWSSGKEAGSVLWDRRPADHLDFCCYCHDMAYDTHDQAQLLRADLAFLRCLQSSRQTPARDGIAAAAIYRSMCIFGQPPIQSTPFLFFSPFSLPNHAKNARIAYANVRWIDGCLCRAQDDTDTVPYEPGAAANRAELRRRLRRFRQEGRLVVGEADRQRQAENVRAFVITMAQDESN